ncbi:ester cyclase [Streptomyces vinaceus]|uniref:ester cyclase n=1 Tax=Streptomyces vinaceus TaxID=1960 RepID=UPI0037F727EF
MEQLEKNKRIARQALVELWTEGDLTATDRLFHPTFVSHQNPGEMPIPEVRGLAELRKYVLDFRNAFLNFADHVSIQCAEGELVATRFVSSGVHTGTFWGIAPTGRQVEWSGTTIDRIVDGKIIENWVNWDSASMLQQIRAT